MHNINTDYKGFRKDYCENIDGRLGFKCTANIVDAKWQLDADHIDGDPTHSVESNMQTLCKCCHAIKTRDNQDLKSFGRKKMISYKLAKEFSAESDEILSVLKKYDINYKTISHRLCRGRGRQRDHVYATVDIDRGNIDFVDAVKSVKSSVGDHFNTDDEAWVFFEEWKDENLREFFREISDIHRTNASVCYRVVLNIGNDRASYRPYRLHNYELDL